MTLRRAHAPSISSSSRWRPTLAVAMLALLVSLAPCAVELCDATCALAHGQAQAGSNPAALNTDASHADAASAPAAPHCAKHAPPGHVLTSMHACQAHGHPTLESTTASVGITRTTFTASAMSAAEARHSAPVPAIMPAADLASLTHAALTPSRLDRLSTLSSRSRPLTVSLRI